MATSITSPQSTEGSDQSRAAQGGALPRIELVHFGAPLGVAGLAGAWTAAETDLDADTWVIDALWLIDLALWVFLGVLYIAQRVRQPRRFGADLRHPVLGPFAASIPLIGTLLTTHFGQYLGGAATIIVWVLVACSGAIAAQLFTHWLTGDFTADFLHPGFLLPLVAAAFVSSIALSAEHEHDGAIAAFGVGLFFWIVIGTVIIGRLITGNQLAAPIKPTLSVLLVPPAVGGVAWLFLNGGVADSLGFALLGILLVFLAVQIMLIREYLKLRVSVAFWTFVFPIAASTNFAIRWLTAAPFAGSTAISWTLLVVTTLAVAFVAAITLGVRAHRA